SAPAPCTITQARGTMLCSSGFSRFPNGSPYRMPTSRRPAATASTAASVSHGGPQVRVRRGRTGPVRGPDPRTCPRWPWPRDLDARRLATDQLGDVRHGYEHCVDARALERD